LVIAESPPVFGEGGRSRNPRFPANSEARQSIYESALFVKIKTEL
jgi:hypothetical protein